MSSNNPDAREPRLAPITYRFEELELFPGVTVAEGAVDILPDAYGAFRFWEVLVRGFDGVERELACDSVKAPEAALWGIIVGVLNVRHEDRILEEMRQAALDEEV